MNDKERDRSDDGAGPKRCRRYFSQHTILIKTSVSGMCRLAVGGMILPLVFLLSTAGTAYSQKSSGAQLRGLSLLVDIGAFKASDYHANFYNGSDANANTLDRIIHSETYGNQIWNRLTEQNLIGSSVANYNQITVAEYGDMYYKLAVQLGIGFRYDYENTGWAWQFRFDYAKLNSQGAVLLNSGHNTSFLTNQDAYVVCPTAGVEERIYFNLGAIRKFRTDRGIDIEASLGGNLNNTKVESSDIKIAGVVYSILDVWRGQYPSSYVGSYEYINQGGLGYGLYASLSVGYTLPVGTALFVGYTFHYNRVNLDRYQSFAPHHSIGLTIALNNFSIF